MIPRPARIALVLLCALAFAPTLASAGTIAWLNRCTPGALRACFSIQIATAPGPNNNTHIVIRIRNQTGWAGFGQSGPFALYGFNLFGKRELHTGPYGMTWWMGTRPTMEDGARLETGTKAPGTSSYEWTLAHNMFQLTGSNYEPITGTIVGCNYDPSVFIGDRYVTCGGGWVVFDITTVDDTGVWDTSDLDGGINVTFYRADRGYSGWPSEYEGCMVSPMPPAYGSTPCIEVTPEPVSSVLIGSGLLGIGFARLRRKRTQA